MGNISITLWSWSCKYGCSCVRFQWQPWWCRFGSYLHLRRHTYVSNSATPLRRRMFPSNNVVKLKYWKYFRMKCITASKALPTWPRNSYLLYKYSFIGMTARQSCVRNAKRTMFTVKSELDRSSSSELRFMSGIETYAVQEIKLFLNHTDGCKVACRLCISVLRTAVSRHLRGNINGKSINGLTICMRLLWHEHGHRDWRWDCRKCTDYVSFKIQQHKNTTLRSILSHAVLFWTGVVYIRPQQPTDNRT